VHHGSRCCTYGSSISIEDLVEADSVAEARFKARMEGQDYVMQGGDVVEFRFNV
jgi:ribosome-binding ATPase YchF (GTP1/OBG family)